MLLRLLRRRIFHREELYKGLVNGVQGLFGLLLVLASALLTLALRVCFLVWGCLVL